MALGTLRGVFLFLISIFQNCIIYTHENDISETHRGKRNLFDSFRIRYLYNYVFTLDGWNHIFIDLYQKDKNLSVRIAFGFF